MGLWNHGEVVVSVSSERNSAEPTRDWVVTTAGGCVPGANVRTATGFLGEKVNTEKDAVACKNGWSDE